jgi:hypothetical protein
MCTLGLPWGLLAQQAGQSAAPTSPPTQPSAPQAPTGPAKDANGKPNPPDPSVPKNDRLFYALPNYLTVENTSSLPPLTAKEKFKLVAEGTFDPIEFGFLALESGVDQASNTNPTFGQGFKGYGKRYALAFGDNGVENFMAGALFPAALHQDPRYYQLGKGSPLHRVVYAALRVVITRADSGKNEFNGSEVFGAATAAAISNAYHPAPRTFVNSLNVWGTQIGWDAVGFETKEFWPDVHRFLARHYHKT